jgi:adenine-specific DNA-methyltransferase
VPQNPDAWKHRKIVFRDISEQPEFWLDTSGAIVNGDCYWIEINDDVFEDVVYLALAIANSKFIEKYYDVKFNTKLYSGKRRYMSQYVEQFPIPLYSSELAQKTISTVKKIIAENSPEAILSYKAELDDMVDKLFA